MAAAFLLVVPVVDAAGPSADRKAPTTPTNLAVTGKTAYSVSFSWGASTDNSSFSYRIVNQSWGTSVVVPSSQTTFTWTASNLYPLQTYAFYVVAVDAAGNWSKTSNTVSTTLLRDTTTPAAPQASLSDNGPTHLSLAWTGPGRRSQPDGPGLHGRIPARLRRRGQCAHRPLLAPQTTHTFTLQARDSGGNVSSMSAPLTATTEASDPNDHTPPTAPANLWGGAIENCEVMLHWGASSDAVTPAQFLRYDVFVNGRHIDSTTLGYTQVDEYGVADGQNRFEVVALDEAGNASAPASATFELVGCVVQ
jgi:chitodextrinase